MDISSHVALVTGAGSGLGEATARALAARGAKVAVLDKHADNATRVADAIGGSAVIADITQPDSIEKALSTLTKTLGPIRCCVNCAGVAPAKRIVGKETAMPLDDFKHVIEINLIGTFNVLRLAAAHMSQLPTIGDTEERGVIINTASIAAFEGQIGQAAYSASKGGVVALTLPAARELSRFGIRVMTIAPGIFATPMMLNMPQAVQDNLSATVPFPKRLGKPEEYAKLVLHILENPMLNGTVIRLDGALRMI
jgi:NAD(P)-dependent dehydrogenase (short-subunit alcohol dehydrogenase family)